MPDYIPVELRKRIEASDRGRCCYCLTTRANSGALLTFDHICPNSKGGKTSFENVCLACFSCNSSKSALTEARDAISEKIISLFNPRTQKWEEHFTWSADKSKIEGLTAIGRVTIATLRMNHSIIVGARRRWSSEGWHPPTD